MSRYFMEVAYKGTCYSGFQVQKNANTVQAEIEKAFGMIHGFPVELTGSSRTDTGVHAFQNYFHFDLEGVVHPQAAYKLNAVLPHDIVVKEIFPMAPEAHSRFGATSREYAYHIHKFKNPFLTDTSFFYPYKLNLEAMQEGALFIKSQSDFFPFAKTNTQVKNFTCTILKSEWVVAGNELIYKIEANRFLRGMVRLITATLLKLGREKIFLPEVKTFFTDQRKCGYSVPPHGLYLQRVNFPENYFAATAQCFTEL